MYTSVEANEKVWLGADSLDIFCSRMFEEEEKERKEFPLCMFAFFRMCNVFMGAIEWGWIFMHVIQFIYWLYNIRPMNQPRFSVKSGARGEALFISSCAHTYLFPSSSLPHNIRSTVLMCFLYVLPCLPILYLGRHVYSCFNTAYMTPVNKGDK